MKRRFPFVPALVIILQVLAVLVLIAVVVPAVTVQLPLAFTQLTSPEAATVPFMQKLQFLLSTFIPILAGIGIWALTWAIADGLSALREIEFNTRAAAPPSAYVEPIEPETKAGGSDIAE